MEKKEVNNMTNHNPHNHNEQRLDEILAVENHKHQKELPH